MVANLSEKDNSNVFFTAIKKLAKQQVYIGIPEATAATRARTLNELAAGVKGKSKHAQRKRNRYARMATQDVSNAQLLYIHTKGSEKMRIPARPVLEPAIEASDNRARINRELTSAADALMRSEDPTPYMKRAGTAGQNAARKWFTDPRNGWAPNAPSTIKRKGSDKPLIDTGAMRAAITYVVKEGE